jgi:hypothetical protein
VTASNAVKYSVSGGVTVLSAVQNPGNAAQVTLTTGVAMNFGTVYTLSVNGVNDLFGNSAHVSGQFARDITIDGSFADWTGLTPVYSTAAPSGIVGAADFENIYMYNDANYYYFRVMLWTDIDPAFGQFPYYVDMFFDTDNNASTGYGAYGTELWVESGFSYHQTSSSPNDGLGINGLNWLSLPQSPGTNFEFQLSRAATYNPSSLQLFTSNSINFYFHSFTGGFGAAGNYAPLTGVVSYTNIVPPTVAALPVGKLAITALAGKQAAVVWDPPGTLQQSSSVTGPWTNQPSAASPYVIPVSGGTQFFRLTQ